MNEARSHRGRKVQESCAVGAAEDMGPEGNLVQSRRCEDHPSVGTIAGVVAFEEKEGVMEG